MKFLILLAALILVTAPAWASSQKEINLGGGNLGMKVSDLHALAKSKRCGLIGPSKGMLSDDALIPVQEFVVNKDKPLIRLPGATRQGFMLLNGRVMAVEIWFSDKKSYTKYLKSLTKIGYTKESENKYVGQLQTGEFAGQEVEVKIGTAPIVGKKTKMLYTVQARCYGVLGKGVTLERIQAAMKSKRQNRE